MGQQYCGNLEAGRRREEGGGIEKEGGGKEMDGCNRYFVVSVAEKSSEGFLILLHAQVHACVAQIYYTVLFHFC